jgi:hypothetical protein
MTKEAGVAFATYMEYVLGEVDAAPPGAPLRSGEVASGLAAAFGIDAPKARRTANAYLKRLADRGALARLKRGVYCKVLSTPFGGVVPDRAGALAGMLLRDGGGAISYDAGPAALNALGLSAMVPRERTIATNRHREALPADAGVRAKRPLAKVTEANAAYLQVIEALRAMRRFPADADALERAVREAIDVMGLDRDELMRYACAFLNGGELRALVRAALGEAGGVEAA